MGALSGLKVLDLTHHVAGPYCTLMLGGYGAEVVKIERPGSGDLSRRLGPFPNDDPHPEKSGLFLHLNRSKKSVTLDLRHPLGRAILLKLAAEADILVESFRPGLMAKLGLEYAVLANANPRLILCSISNFGQTGPYRDWKATDMVLFGTGGAMHTVGLPDREPVQMVDGLQLYHGGLMAADAILSAVHMSDSSGTGQYVDLSLFEAALGNANWRRQHLAGYAYTGRNAKREASVWPGFPTGAFPCKDGYISIVAGMEHFPRVCALIGRPELATDDRFCTREAQLDPARKDEFLKTYFLPWAKSLTKEEFLRLGQKAKTLCGAVNETADVFKFSQFRERRYFQELDHPIAGRLTYTGAPMRMPESPWAATRAPMLGEHNREVLMRLGYAASDIVRLRSLNVI